MTESQRKLIGASIVEYLTAFKTAKDEEDEQSLQLAIQIITEQLGAEDTKSVVKLETLFEVFSETKTKTKTNKDSAQDSQDSQHSQHSQHSAQDKTKAEALKSEGNKLLASKDFKGAVAKYSDAIENDRSNAVYYANRAAAKSQLGEHTAAVADAKKALEVNPDYSKSYSRLGHAEFCLGNFENAVDAYSKGLEKEPNNASIKQSLAAAKQKASEATSVRAPAPAAGDMSQMPAGFPPGGMGGLPPNLANMMKDPNIMKMAQSMMSNPNMAGMMENMMKGGGGMPDVASLMKDPEVAAMAGEMMKDPSAIQGLMDNPDMADMAKKFMNK